uniref:Serpentine receptor class gamma n=1 Tax=Plectus sambesii TaxID=2011161 RepID=A0A914X0Z4_9BILA
MEWFLAQLFTFLAFALDMAMFITTPIYILVLITLWKNRNEETLKHAFFKLMISVGIADVGTILNIFFTTRLAEWGWAPQIFIWLGGMSSRIANTCKSFFGTSQALGVLVVALNRYTAFMIPLKHQKWVYPKELLYYALPVTIVGKGLIVVFVFIIYGIIFVVTFKASRTSARVATNAEKAALNMSIVGFVHCIGLAIAVFFFIAQEISYFGFNHNLVDIIVITFINNLGYNFFSAINPYALLIFSKSVRTQFFKMYRINMVSLPFSGKTNVEPLAETTRSVGQIDQHIEL